MRFSVFPILSLPLVGAFVGPITTLQTFKVKSLLSSPQLEQEQVATVTKEKTITKPVKREQITSFILSPLDNSPPLELPPENKRPGLVEDVKFKCDNSVDFWKDFASEGNSKNLDRVRSIVAKHVLDASPESRAYWVSHVLRTSYFLSNAALGLLGTDLHTRFITNRNSRDQSEKKDGRLGTMLNSNSDVSTRLLLESMLCYEQDWENIHDGRIEFPWDAFVVRQGNSFQFQTSHKQFNPLFALQETSRLVRESIGVFGRQNKFGGKPGGVWIDQQNASKTPYPEYYLNDFHYQTDGWMSNESAERYDISTETLFLGRQDSMQRQTLLPLHSHFGTNEPKTLLEVACGTGRFATFTRDNFRSTDVTLMDLSPFYLEKARRNDEYWRKYQQVDKQTTAATFVQANAEYLPFEDNSFDCVTCVYLFHELPETARAQAAAEMARVVKKGGIVVLTDSVQLGDRPGMDENIGRFSNLNEPHYQNYIRTEIAPLFEKHSLVCHEKYVASSTKTLSFIKR